MVQLSHLCMTTRKTIPLTKWTFVSKIMCLLFNMLSRFLTAFLPRSKSLLISWLQSIICGDFGDEKNKVCHCFHFSPLLFAMKWWDWKLWSLFFECWALSQLLHSPLSPSSEGSLVPLHFLPLEWYHLHIWGCWYCSWQSGVQLVIHKQPSILEVKSAGWEYTALMYSFLNFESFSCSM